MVEFNTIFCHASDVITIYCAKEGRPLLTCVVREIEHRQGAVGRCAYSVESSKGIHATG